MLSYFNEHLISSGFLFEFLHPEQSVSEINLKNASLSSQIEDFFFSFYACVCLRGSESIKDRVDTIKAAGPDNLDTFSLTLTAYFIAEPLSFIFNLCLFSNETQEMWKAPFVLPLPTYKCQ